MGISDIKKRREERSRNQEDNDQRRDLFFRDGDIAVVGLATKGEDALIEEFQKYVYPNGSGGFSTILVTPELDYSVVPEDIRPSRRLGFWAYVFDVLHKEKRMDNWEEVTVGGTKYFKESVENFRLIELPAAHSFEALSSVYEEMGEGIQWATFKVSRSGSGRNTTYSIAYNPRQREVPQEAKGRVDDLPTVMSYLRERYPLPKSENGTESEEVSIEEEDFDF